MTTTSNAVETASPTPDRCACGQPVQHLTADPDTAEWACRIPDARPKPAGIDEIECARQGGFDAGYDEGVRDGQLSLLESLGLLGQPLPARNADAAAPSTSEAGR